MECLLLYPLTETHSPLHTHYHAGHHLSHQVLQHPHPAPPSPSVHTGLLSATTSTHDMLPSNVSTPIPLPTRPVYCGAVSSTSSGSSTSHPLMEPPEPAVSVVPSNLSPFDFQATPTTSITNLPVKLPKLTLRKFSRDLTKWVHSGIPLIQPNTVIPTFPVWTNSATYIPCWTRQ